MPGEEGDDWTFDEEPRPGGEREFPGKDILNLASPLEVLGRLLEGDPLGVHLGSWQRLEDRALLLDHALVSRRCFARVARAGPVYRGHPPLAAWLRQRYDQSIGELLSEELEDELQGMPVDARQPRVKILRRNFGLESGLARRACIRFNALPERVRRAFFAVNLRGRTMSEYGLAVDCTYDQVLSDLDQALRAISSASSTFDLDLPDFADPTW